MALNYSHRPIFPSRIPEDNIVHGGSQEKDIHDILPADPFGMDISSTVTAITGWLEDLGVSNCGKDEVGVGKGHYPILGGLNVWWDTAMDFQPYLGQKKTFDTMFRSDRFEGFVTEEALERFVDDGCSRYGCCTMENVVFGCRDGCAHESKGVLNHKNTDDWFGGFVTEEALGRFVDGSCIRYGCCTVEGAVFGCGNVCAHRSKNVLSHKNMDDRFGEFVTRDPFGHFFGKHGVHHGCDTMKDVLFGCGETSSSGYEEKNQEVDGGVDETVDGSPHPALSFALAYLGVRDLLVVERVCKSFQFTVQNDPLLWRSIHIDHPLNARVTDDVLVQLTNRAQGNLQCLSLVDCKGVTNEGLRRVLESNLRLTKLSVPGCINLKIEGIINCLKAFQPRAIPGLKCLRVAGRLVSFEQYEELLSLLGIHNHVQPCHQKPHFYCRGNVDLSCEDDRPIDLEICPKCKMAKLVYDCTTESCQAKDQAGHLCRACIQCIYRCYQCGRCIDGVVHEEDFFLDYVCSDCSPEISKCQDGHVIGSSFSMHDVSCELDG